MVLSPYLHTHARTHAPTQVYTHMQTYMQRLSIHHNVATHIFVSATSAAMFAHDIKLFYDLF